jgi:integrase
MVILNEGHLGRFLAAASGHRLYALFALAAGSGMRQGEILGLQWEDLDLERGAVTVRRSLAQVNGKFIPKELKSKAGRRTIKLPPFAVDALREHRRKMLYEGNIKAPVFCTRTGDYIGKSNLIRQTFKPLLKKANATAAEEAAANGAEPDLLPGIRFHDLRHTPLPCFWRRGIRSRPCRTGWDIPTWS